MIFFVGRCKPDAIGFVHLMRLFPVDLAPTGLCMKMDRLKVAIPCAGAK